MLLAALITYSSIYSQTIISGSVNDNKNKPLQGASITLKDTYDGATTDSTGHFSFKTTEKGDHIILASVIGYKGFEQKISLSGQSIKLSINLKEEINELISKDSSVDLKLPYSDNHAAFEFTTTSYLNEKEILYSYRLKGGVDTAWSHPSNSHSVQ